MRVVVAPDSFKGSLTALQAAEAMARGVRAVWPAAEVVQAPIADGGEGTAAALVAARRGRFEERDVAGPLGETVRAAFGVFDDTAVIEMAAASGLTLTPRRDPLRATTRGTGELIEAALDLGLRKLVIGLGGSATNDGGSGMARALGVRFLDEAGRELPEGGAALQNLARVELTGLDPRLRETELLIACDVDNPLSGPRGASAVYGPQKGATPEMVRQLDAALSHYAQLAEAATGRRVADLPGAGAAGGLGFGLLLFTRAQLRPGVQVVLEALGFDELIAGATLILTGEGKTDAQTAMGKAPIGVAAAAARRGVPVVCLSGALGEGAEEVLQHGIAALASSASAPRSLEESLARAAELLEAGAARACRLIELGRKL